MHSYTKKDLKVKTNAVSRENFLPGHIAIMSLDMFIDLIKNDDYL